MPDAIRMLRRFARTVPSLLLLPILPASARAVCNKPFQFSPATTYTVGPNPSNATVGDFNEDGKDDLAVPISYRLVGGGPTAVAIYLGHGDGMFDPPVQYAVGAACRMIGLGDFNEDGITDIAVANQDGASVSVLIGLGSGGVGNGTFAPSVAYPSNGGPMQVRTGDFNGDGITDLAVPNNTQFSVSILFGQGSGGVGNGTFGPPVSYPLNNYSLGLAVSDFNEDGILDLVATENYSGTVAVLIGQGSGGVGNGTFAPAAHYPAGAEPYDVMVHDFDGDGIQDLGVANTAGGGVAFLHGNGSGGVGNGTFAPAVILPSGNSTQASVGDVNQDGIEDLIISIAAYYGEVRVYLGLGNGQFGPTAYGAPTEYAVGRDPIMAAHGDFNGDGKLDLAVPNYEENTFSVLLGACTINPNAPTLTRVRDVPNDQGGKVFVTWTRSALDVPGGSVLNYRVWRRIPPELALAASRGGTPMSARAAGAYEAVAPIRIARPVDGIEGAAVEYWEEVATMPAQRLPGYGYTSSTPQDSMHFSNPYTAFFITAATGNPDVYYSSDVDSGYSVDNLPPHGPNAFVAQVTPGGAIALHWGANAEPDLIGYRLYRGSTSDFVPGAGNLISAQPDTGFTDHGAPGFTYKLTAVDKHENESPCATTTVSSLITVDPPTLEFALANAMPNPSRDGSLVMRLSLPGAGPARIEALDVAGRQVAAQWVSGVGPHTVELAPAGKLPAAVYMVRATWAGLSRSTKAVIVK